MTEQKPVAWTYEYHNGERWMRLLVRYDPSTRGPDDPTPIRNVQAWFDLPQPVEEPEQKPYGYAFFSMWSGKDAFSFTKPDPTVGRDIRPLYDRPAPSQPATDPEVEELDQKPVAWIYDTAYSSFGAQPVLAFDKPEPGHPYVRGPVRPLYERPAPSQPATDPEVEAARRKALRYLLDQLERNSQCSDRAPVTVTLGLLRDLVGQPRKRPDERIVGYDKRDA